MFLKTINRDIEILLIRHAETSYNTENKTYTITPNGKKQIKQLSAYLKDLKIDKIYCSTMKRSIETAKPVEESHGLTIETREELNEINRGDVDTDEKWGMYEDYYHLWRQHKFDLPFPHGENGEEVWLRSKYVVDSILDDARKSKPEKDPYRVCVFTHGGTLRSMVCGILDIPQINRYQILKEFDNCSITRIKVSSNALANVNTSKPFVLESLNDTSYRNDRK
jgi:broad specificity phosphatase PhoE